MSDTFYDTSHRLETDQYFTKCALREICNLCKKKLFFLNVDLAFNQQSCVPGLHDLWRAPTHKTQ